MKSTKDDHKKTVSKKLKFDKERIENFIEKEESIMLVASICSFFQNFFKGNLFQNCLCARLYGNRWLCTGLTYYPTE